MFRPLPIAFLVLNFTALVPAPMLAAGGSAPSAVTKKVTTAYAVQYRRAGVDAWTNYKTFSRYEDAVAAAQKLHKNGFETQLEAKTALLKVPAPKTFKLPESETVTLRMVGALFTWMANQRDIAFRYPTDGCYARAHLMMRRLQKAGYKPCKVWSFQNGEPLYARTKNHPNGFVTWKYHVAPLLRVRFENGSQRWYVIDPSLFGKPVTIAKWRDGQKRPGSKYSPYVALSRSGHAPLDINRRRLPGTGYWPALDPREGADRHALETMKRYKPREGRTPPTRTASALQARSRRSRLARAS
jgi:hypothetical protein